MLLRGALGLVFLYLKLIHVSCEGSTLAFAIDDTLSMTDDIAEVKKEAEKIMNIVLTEKTSEIKDFVLVTINDPDVELRTYTNSSETFRQHINSIEVHNRNNPDCEEMSLSGLGLALQKSRSGSYIYVFTDASAKDYKKVNEIKSLCQKKQSQVVFVLTGDCKYPSHKTFTVYYDIAATCSGQVFRVDKDQVNSVLQTVKILLKGRHSVVKWKVVPGSFQFTKVPFTIDEKADYALVSTTGRNVKLRVSTTNHINGPEPEYEKIMWNNNGRVLKLINLKPGTYYAYVKGDSATTVVIYERTDFTFEHGFSILEPKSIADTSKQPIAGKPQHISINVTDTQNTVEIKSVQILDIRDNILKEIPLKKINNNFYITELYTSPTHVFKIKVIGVIKKTQEPISRISKTAVTPQIIIEIPETVPDVKISEGVDTYVDYGSRVTLTCKVNAHPAPRIQWFTSGGTALSSQNSQLEESTYISYLTLPIVKYNGTFVCKATNKKGSSESKNTIHVRPIFDIISVPAGTIHAKYGEDTTIQCKIKSSLPIHIKWYWSGQPLNSNAATSISADGSTLTLKSADVGMNGIYTCKASLDEDPTVTQTFHTDVKITKLVPPTIVPINQEDTQFKKGDNIELNCRIQSGEPKPTIQWYKNNGNDFEKLTGETGQQLILLNSSYTHIGQYKCVAVNVAGSATVVFDINLSSAPEVTVPNDERKVPYGSDVEFSCNVESLPPVTVMWTDDKGSILQEKVDKTSEHSFTSQLKLNNVKESAVYICKAANNDGQSLRTVSVEVISPFDVNNHIDDNTGIDYGTEKTLHCDIRSSQPITISWYLQDIGLTSSRIKLSSSDKYTISQDGTELKINFMDVDMVGKYTCEAALVSDPKEIISFNSNVNVIGLMSPQVTYSTTLLNGRNFTAICRIKGLPKPTITWQFKPKDSEQFVTIPGSEEVYDIPEIKLKDSGIYKFIAENRLGKAEHTFNVVVEEPPEITNDITAYYGLKGDKYLKISCVATGFPEPDITWGRSGNFEHDNNELYSMRGNTLTITDPKETSDTLLFVCTAKNKLGTASKNFTVDITDTFENDRNYYGKIHNVFVENSMSVTLRCGIIDSKTLSVRWYKNGIPTEQTGNMYTIEKTKMLFDDGNYTCRVNTEEGSKSENYVLDVGYPPQFQFETQSPKTVNWLDKDIDLDCSVTAKPTEKIEWLYNGKKVNNPKNSLRVTGLGEYTCIVRNVHGSIRRTYNVESAGCYLTKDSDPRMPLITDNDLQSWPEYITNNGLVLKKNETITLICPSDKSSNGFQSMPHINSATAVCNTQDQLSFIGKIYKYQELKCTRPVEPAIVRSKMQCAGENTELISVGFKNTNNLFEPLFLEAYNVCFDTKINMPLFVNAPITIDYVQGGNHSTYKWKLVSGLGEGNPSSVYTCSVSNKLCYEKHQLLIPDELPFGAAQAATFLEPLNAIPLWNPCPETDRTSWQHFEKDLMKTSTNFNTWKTWTGASNYARKNGGLVPRYLWKMIMYDEEMSAMVYVNDLLPETSDIRCTQPCENFVKTTDKFIYCCSAEEFSKVFGISLDSFQSEKYSVKADIL